VKWVQIEIPVRYAECDPMGVVHNSNYFVWFEMGRIALADAASLNFKKRHEELYVPVIDIRCQYKESARFGNTVILETALKQPTKATLEFVYRLYRKHGRQLLAEGYSVHALTRPNGQLLLRLPEDVKQCIDDFLGGTP